MAYRTSSPTPEDRVITGKRPLTFLKASLIGIILAFVGVLLLPMIVGKKMPQVPVGSDREFARLEEKTPYPRDPEPAPKADEPAPKSESPADTAQDPEPADATAEAEAAAGDDDSAGAEKAEDDASLAGEQDASEPSGSAAAPAPVLARDDYPFPRTFSKEEMDEALKPLLTYTLAEADEKALKDVLALLDKRKFQDARSAIPKIGNEAARSFATWQYLRLADLGATASEIESFVEQNPLFPSERTLAARLETALFWNNAPPAKIAKFLGDREPETGLGRALKGQLYLTVGDRDTGVSLIRSVWRTSALDGPLKEKFLARFKDHLTDEDHALRDKALEFERTKDKVSLPVPPAAKRGVTRSQKGRSLSKKARGTKKKRKRPARKKKNGQQSELVSPGSRFAGLAAELARAVVPSAEAAPRKTNAPGQAPLPERRPEDTPPDESAGIALPERRPDATVKAEPEKAPATAQDKAAENAVALKKELAVAPARLYARVRQLRRTNKERKAWSLIRSMPPEISDLIAPEDWWGERRIHVRDALDQGQYRTAYAIASGRGPLTGEALSEAEFLAGWIAYRFLEDPERAERHFLASKTADALPRDVARGAYFLGRVKRDLNRSAEADAEFAEAAQHYFTYYGQLAHQARTEEVACQFRSPPRPEADAIRAFNESNAARAVMIAKQLGLDRELRALLVGFAREIKDPVQMTLAFELMRRVAQPNFVVRVAKIALNRGLPVDIYSFPRLLPEFEALGDSKAVEHALLHALTRQESEFNAGAVSPAGARGLMQLMPATARLVASQNKVKYELPRLTTDPAYNVQLGAAFLNRLIASYEGSYLMAVAAYNAGPGRVRGWLKEFGDPRKADVDPVDWIERIPFTETRNYVQRVMEGLQLYRCRFEKAQTPVLLVRDLHRGRADIPATIQAGAAN